MQDNSGKPTEGIIDYTTGIIRDVPPDRKAITVPKKLSISGTKKSVSVSGNFVKILDSAYAVMANITLSKSEQKILNLLVPLAQYHSQVCRHKNKKPITAKWLARETKLKADTVSRALKSLEDYGFILRQDGKIIVNPYYAPRGKTTDANVVWLFRDTEFYKAWAELPINRNVQ